MAGYFDSTWSTSTMTDTAKRAAASGQSQWDSLKDQNAKNVATAADVSARAIDTSKNWDKFADSELDRYKTDYVPAEKKQLDDAMGWASPDRMARMRGMAMGDQRQAGDAAKARAEDELLSYGVDPSSGRFGGLDANLEAKTGAAMAAAGTMSDVATELQGQQLLGQAIQTGKSVPQIAQGAAGVGLTAGNQAVNAPLAATGVQAQTMGTPTQWAQLEQQGYKGAIDSMVQSANISNQAAAIDAQSSSGIGAIIGGGLGLVGTLAGAYFGGPMGAMMGGSIGRAAAGAVPGKANGGMVQRYADGGVVNDMDGDEAGYVDPSMSPSGGAVTDDIHAQIDGDPSQPAKINSGEFIMPRDVVAWRGEAWMQKEIEKARKEMAARGGNPDPAQGQTQQVQEVPSAIATRPPAFVPTGAAA
jgi:hypothetical protein